MAYDFTTDGSLLTSQGQPAANFAPSAAALFWTPGETASPGGLRLTFRHLGRVHTVDLDIQSGSLLQQLCRAVPTCRILLPARREAVENYLLELAAAHPGPPGLYFPRTGLYRLPESGTWVYACGSEVLGLPQGTDFLCAPEIAHLRLAADPALSSGTAARELLRVLEQDPAIYFPLWSFTLLGMLHSALSRLWQNDTGAAVRSPVPGYRCAGTDAGRAGRDVHPSLSPAISLCRPGSNPAAG